MSRDEIRSALLSALNTQNWKKLQNSLVGKELISFGVETIAASQDINESIISAFDYQTATVDQLVSMSRTWDVPLSFNKPASIRLTLESYGNFAPYELKFTSGSATFFNIDYISGTEVVLYQGIPHVSVEDTSIFPFVPSVQGIWNNVPWNEFNVEVGTDESLSGISLGLCVPESVYATYKTNTEDAIEGILSQFSPIRYFSTIPAYKLYTLSSQEIMFLSGNSKWALSPYEVEADLVTHNYYRQVFWLEPTNVNFSTNGTLIYREHELAYSAINATSPAEFNSLEYAREYTRHLYVKLNGITSEQQIKDYVKGFPYVLDCAVQASNNLINIYVKPTDPNDNGAYGAIEANLDLLGTVSTIHKVKTGTKVEFQFKAKLISGSNAGIDEFIREKYAYSKLSYDALVDIVELVTAIQNKFGALISIHMYVSPTVYASGTTLSMIPNKGSIQLYDDVGGPVVGYDLNGQLLKATIQENEQVPDYSCLRTSFGGYCKSNIISDAMFCSFISGVEGTLMQKVASSKSVQYIFGSNFDVYTSSGYAYAYINSESAGSSSATVAVISTDAITPIGLSGNLSIISNTTLQIAMLDPLGVTPVIPLYINGILMTLKGGTQKELSFYSGVSALPYYTYIIPDAATILGVYHDDLNLFIFTSNKIIQVYNINTNLIGWKYLDLDRSNLSDFTSWNICAVHAYNKNRITVAFRNGNSFKLAVLSGIHASASKCTFNVSKIYTIGRTSSENILSVVDLGTGCILNAETFSAYTDDYSSITIVDGSTPPATLDLLNEAQPYVIGTINYDTGLLVTQSEVLMSYTSDKISRNKDQFIAINTQTPVVWTSTD